MTIRNALTALLLFGISTAATAQIQVFDQQIIRDAGECAATGSCLHLYINKEESRPSYSPPADNRNTTSGFVDTRNYQTYTNPANYPAVYTKPLKSAAKGHRPGDSVKAKAKPKSVAKKSAQVVAESGR